MSNFDETRWHEDCFKRCGDCTSCLNWDNNIEETQVICKKFITVGSVRYGIRLGAVSPPPPGAGPRYRSRCCWYLTPGPGPVSRFPLFTASSINSHDIFRCVNRMRMAEDTTSELSEQAIVCDQVLYSTTKPLLKNQLRRRALVRPQTYVRLCECGDGEGADIQSTLDRLPRFRFGGNRGNNSKVRERDKRENERLRELTDRLKRGPAPPPRTRHVQHRAPQSLSPLTTPTPENNEDICRTLPIRSASFSQVDYSIDDKKYVRRRPQVSSHSFNTYNADASGFTLPRSKNSSGVGNLPTHNPEQDGAILNAERVTEIKCKEASNPAGKNDDITSIRESVEKLQAQEKRRDKSRRRKGMYISQWPNDYQATDDVISQLVEGYDFTICTEAKPTPDTGEIPKLQVNNDSVDCVDDCNTSLEPSSPDDEQILYWSNSNISSLSCPPPDDNKSGNPRANSRKTQLLRVDSFSESEPDQVDRRSDRFTNISDVSDSEIHLSATGTVLTPHVPRRYYKRPLRGPYGQMLEAEMKKPEADRKNQYNNDLKFLEVLSSKTYTSSTPSLSPSSPSTGEKQKCNNRTRVTQSESVDYAQIKNSIGNLSGPNKQTLLQPEIKRKTNADCVENPSYLVSDHPEQKLVISHQRTTSSPSKLEGITSGEASHELLDHLLRGSSEQLLSEVGLQHNDTRTHVVVELYDTERSYVESLQILVTKYLEPLKNPDNSGLLDVSLVDEIFFQVPALLNHHHLFLEELKKRLEHWDVKQKLGDLFLEMFSKPAVIETYTNYVNNWKRAREIIKNAQQSKPSFARFLEAMAREHKGKLALDSLLIKPIQKFPKYELLLQRLIKHTDPGHPDHSLLLNAQREIHEQLLKINCTEREALELEQLREIEGLIEGLIELVSSDRQYMRHDLVSMAAGGGTRKERALFLFSDLLLVTSIKRRSGTIKRPIPSSQATVTSSLEANKYKLLMKVPLHDLEIVRTKDENLRQMMLEIENSTEDIAVLNQINELVWTLNCPHTQLDEIIKDMLSALNKQLVEQQNSDSQLSCLDLTLNTSNGLQNISIMFSKPEKRTSWEETFNEAKHKLAMSGDRRPCPELVTAVPIRKTRAGLQFTCAAPTIGDGGRDVWVCNSDGYVGQVCILSLQPEPTVTSCNGVCNAKILCITSVPGISNSFVSNKGVSSSELQTEQNTIQFDSSSSSEDDDKSDSDEPEESKLPSCTTKSAEPVNVDTEDADVQQSTMWLGTEDGCIHIYNSSDNIRIKKNKLRLQHGSAILCIIYFDNRVFVSLANGDIIIYERDHLGGWNTSSPLSVAIGTTTMPASKMIPNAGKLWCGCGNTIKVVNIQTFVTENTFTVNNDFNKPITCIVILGNGVWLSLQNSAIVKCYHALSFECLCEMNISPAVTKMLTSCDDIIRQHKAACLRVTSLLACKDLLWIGTSAGVLLTVPLPHIAASTTKLSCVPNIFGVPHGHTGHIRFLTHVEWHIQNVSVSRHSYKKKSDQRSNTKLLIISGGDGYEDFRNTNLSEVAGREDSTNHLLLWNI